MAEDIGVSGKNIRDKKPDTPVNKMDTNER